MLTSNFNLWDLTNMVRSPQFIEENKDRYHGHALIRPDVRFHGFADVSEIDSILNKEVINSTEVLQHNRTFDMISDVSGSVVNIDAYLNGEPEDMYNFVSSESNIVEDLNIYISLSWKVPVQDIAAAAQRIKAYVESRPANVSLNINIRTDYRKVWYVGKTQSLKNRRVGVDKHTLLLNVASADDYLTPQVINLIGHPIFYRWVILGYKSAQLDSNCTVEQCPTDWMNFINGNSNEVYNQIEDNSLHLVFQDANHTFPMTISDFFCFEKKVKKGGYYAIHDCGSHIAPKTGYQYMGSEDDEDMYISCRKAIKRIGLLDNKFEGWELVFDEADTENLMGGICVFRKI